MKKIKSVFRIGAVLCAAFTAFAFASCGKNAAEDSPFKYTFIGGNETFSESAHTYGYIKETVSEEVTATYCYARVAVLNIGGKAAALNADDFSLEADGEAYAGDGFISFNKESEKSYAEDGSYTETVITSIEENLSVKEIEPSREPIDLKISFALSSYPDAYSVCYKGIPLGVADGTAEGIMSRGTNVGESLFMGAVALDGNGSDSYEIKFADTGTAVYSCAYINETKVEATYNAISVKATVGTDDVTVEAEKFILKSGDKSYRCKGFASSATSSEQIDEILVTTTKVSIASAYVIKSDEIGDMHLVFEYDFSSIDEFTLYYGETELTE